MSDWRTPKGLMVRQAHQPGKGKIANLSPSPFPEFCKKFIVEAKFTIKCLCFFCIRRFNAQF
ncbi:hypothetical protein VF10_20555 [Nostoc linckia z13]|nr:hypothetical protein VF05_00005 [Nostoc linckia z3]PHK15933.1 hypothetical protein VF11_26465 [Nostoc linckia z14]PHK20058.1 hypothetical protein VF10_20555 [Nostoc linckia z13]